MGSELRVDLTALADAAVSLGRIAGDFSTTDISIEQMTASIGSKNETHELRNAVEHFAYSWSVRRKKVQEDVTYMAEMAQTVSDVLSQTDKDMATSLSNTTTNTQSSLTPTGGSVAGGGGGGGSVGSW